MDLMPLLLQNCPMLNNLVSKEMKCLNGQIWTDVSPENLELKLEFGSKLQKINKLFHIYCSGVFLLSHITAKPHRIPLQKQKQEFQRGAMVQNQRGFSTTQFTDDDKKIPAFWRGCLLLSKKSYFLSVSLQNYCICTKLSCIFLYYSMLLCRPSHYSWWVTNIYETMTSSA